MSCQGLAKCSHSKGSKTRDSKHERIRTFSVIPKGNHCISIENNQKVISGCKANILGIEGLVNFGCIVAGILQILALDCSKLVWKKYCGWFGQLLRKSHPKKLFVRLSSKISSIISAFSRIRRFIQ